MITDQISFYSGYIINFGVAFEVIAHNHANKQDVKLRCMNKIIEYFNIEKMKFIGLRPSRKIKVMNGKLECSFRKFEVYEGSKKAKKQ